MAVNPATASAAPQITGAIRQAAQSTGISFEYLLTTAKIESNFNPSAQASTSSAKGLYQFIDQTWLGTMKRTEQRWGSGATPTPSRGRRTGAMSSRIQECALRSCSCAAIQKPARCWRER
jgi:soluble lytic murein transglycosylase-like protein